MNFKKLINGIPAEWEMTNSLADIEHLYDDILWQLKEYEGDVSDTFVVLNDSTIYQIMLILQWVVNVKEAKNKVSNDLKKLARCE